MTPPTSPKLITRPHTSLYIIRGVQVVTNIFLLLWFSLKADRGYEPDYSILPSFFGPGAYLAWIITWLDYYSLEWWDLICTLLCQYPRRTPLDHLIRNEPRTMQRLVLWAYGVVSVGWFLYQLKYSECTGEQKAAAAAALGFIGKTVYFVTLPSDQLAYVAGASPAIVLGSWDSLPFPAFKEFSSHLVFIFGVLTSFGNIPKIYLRVEMWYLRFEYTWDYLIGAAFVFAATFLFSWWWPSGAQFEIRPPWPRTEHSIMEMDQLFAVGLAVVSFVFARRGQLKTGWKALRRRGTGLEHTGVERGDK